MRQNQEDLEDSDNVSTISFTNPCRPDTIKADLISQQDFILSILQSSPSVRDSRSYISSFSSPTADAASSDESIESMESSEPTASTIDPSSLPVFTVLPEPIASSTTPALKPPLNLLVNSLLNPTVRHPALVKVQGPFDDVQLDSVAKGMARLQKLGLVSVIVVDRDDIPSSEPRDNITAQRQRTLMLRDVERMVHFLNRHRAQARPVLATVTRQAEDGDVFVEEEGLDHVRRAVQEGEIPVLLPVALDAGCRARRVGANAVLAALAKAMSTHPRASRSTLSPRQIDLTPMRLLVINREGGIPSYARSGMPHLSVNLASEYQYINDTFNPDWRTTHPTALSNLTLAQACLQYMPKEASALVVSHRSPAAMIGNLITNKPAHSASLPHSLLSQSEGRITRDTPTLIRKGSPVKVLRSIDEVDRDKLTELLERSFGRKLNKEAYFARLERDLDFVIVIGDYAGAALCTLEGRSESRESAMGAEEAICYLDKFAVLPQHQGDGTVDFLWVALRDETYGLGLLDAANPSEGSLSGKGRGRDLVWRSRCDNPVNKWYHERSSGFLYLHTEKERKDEMTGRNDSVGPTNSSPEGNEDEAGEGRERATMD